MSTQIRISAKNLGELALPNFCPRCFWLKLHLSNKLPFQIFPGIFSSIDGYTKNIVKAHFERNGKSPGWLEGLGEITGYREPPHYTKFGRLDPQSNVLLRGTPDGIFVRPDKSFIIADYKTAKYTGTQDSLFPMYEVQLNAYALIAEQSEFKPVSDLALIYMEPLTNSDALVDINNHRNNGFALGFAANIHKVPLNPAGILPLLAKTREIYELPRAPDNCGCNDCQALENLLELSSRQATLF